MSVTVDKQVDRYAKLYLLKSKIEKEMNEIKAYITDRFDPGQKIMTPNGLVQTYETTRWTYSDTYKKTATAFKQTLSELEAKERSEGTATPQTTTIVKVLLPKTKED